MPGTVSQTGIKFQNEKLARNKRGPTSGKPDESAVANSSVVNAMEAARGPRQGARVANLIVNATRAAADQAWLARNAMTRTTIIGGAAR
jgi:hypothetical protein